LGFAVLFISHDLPLLLEVSNRVAIMRDGEIVEYAPARQILDEPRHPYTRHLLESFPSLTGARGQFMRSAEPEAPAGEPVPPGGAR
jgi:ABC-type dipeptide/oligopeptide/nickel transport system ATPase component